MDRILGDSPAVATLTNPTSCLLEQHRKKCVLHFCVSYPTGKAPDPVRNKNMNWELKQSFFVISRNSFTFFPQNMA